MTARPTTTAAGVLAILAAVCAAHHATESTQVSACNVPRRRVVTKGIPEHKSSNSPNAATVSSPSVRAALPDPPPRPSPTHASPDGPPCGPQPHRPNPRTTAVALSLSLLSLPLFLPVRARRGVPALPHLSVDNHPNSRHRVSHGRTYRCEEDEEPGKRTPRRGRPRPRTCRCSGGL